MAANEDVFWYHYSLMQAAVASWIEPLRHWAIEICIDFNEVSYIFRVIAVYRNVSGRTGYSGPHEETVKVCF